MTEQARLVPFWSLFSLGRGLNITKADYVDEGCLCLSYGDIHSRYKGFVDPSRDTLPKVSKDYIKSNSSSLLVNGDIVFADTSEDYEGSGDATCVIGSSDCLFAGYHTTIAKPKDKSKTFSPYFGYYFQTPHFRNQIVRQVNGVKVYSITNKILNSTKVPLPPLKEQRDKVLSLQGKVSRIDATISRLLKLSSKVQVYRQSLITHAVTKGLDPTVPMKDSGIPWIGKMPESWELIKLKFLGRSINGLTYSPDDLCSDGDGIPVLRSSNVQNNKLDFKDTVYIPLSISKDAMLDSGDILICARNGSQKLVGKCAYISESNKYAFGAFMMRYRSHLKKYAYYMFCSDLFKYHKHFFTTTTINQLTTTQLGDMFIPVPSDIERNQIVEYLDNKTKTIDSVIDNLNSNIVKLDELRNSIISNAFR